MKAMLSSFLFRIGPILYTIYRTVQVIGIRGNGLKKGFRVFV